MIYLQYIKNFGGNVETLYDILEVSRKASKEVIEKAYKTLAKKYHPDLQTAENKEIAEKRMKEINEAYNVLSDEQKRKEYDEKLEAEDERKKQEEYIATREKYRELIRFFPFPDISFIRTKFYSPTDIFLFPFFIIT